jgi:hypothetical protein
MGVWHWLITDQPAWVSNVSNLTAVTVFGALLGLWKRFNCNQRRCWRIGHHRVEGTTYRTCAKHATLRDHTALRERHARERPEQHELMNQPDGTVRAARAVRPAPPESR